MQISSAGVVIKQRLRRKKIPIAHIEEVWVSGGKKEDEGVEWYGGEIAWCIKKSPNRIVYYYGTQDGRQYRKLNPILVQWEAAGVRVVRSQGGIREVDG